MTEPVASADDLFALAPKEFTRARDALAKRLKREGCSGEAAEVSKLRRPPLTAWALNQVARRSPELVAAVLESGELLRRATTDALGGDRATLAPARDEERRAVGAAVAAAATFLASDGNAVTDASLRRMEGTLRAATMDGDVAARLSRGVLLSDGEAVGLGLDDSLLGSVPSGAKPSAGARAEHRDQARRKEMDAEVEGLRRRARLLRSEAEEASRKADRLFQEAAEADGALKEAEERRARPGAGG